MPKLTAADAQAALMKDASPARAKISLGFFKTGPGEYGEGDRFIGVTVPMVRCVAKVYRDLPWSEIRKLTRSPIHEIRVLAFAILVTRYQRGDAKTQREAHALYLKCFSALNNWDLVDLSAPQILGAELHKQSAPQRRAYLDRLVRSKRMWDRRIAIVSTQYLIRERSFADTLRLSKTLLNDREDLMHKASGWMLREVGKRDERPLRRFLDQYATQMPRTMLRYSLERLPPSDRARYMGMKASRKAA